MKKKRNIIIMLFLIGLMSILFSIMQINKIDYQYYSQIRNNEENYEVKKLVMNEYEEEMKNFLQYGYLWEEGAYQVYKIENGKTAIVVNSGMTYKKVKSIKKKNEKLIIKIKEKKYKNIKQKIKTKIGAAQIMPHGGELIIIIDEEYKGIKIKTNAKKRFVEIKNLTLQKN